MLALFDLAEIYKNGNTEEKEKSAVYYQRAVKGWKVLAEKENLTNHQKEQFYINLENVMTVDMGRARCRSGKKILSICRK